jgi:formylmethanofuran dehydrogenase subunit E
MNKVDDELYQLQQFHGHLGPYVVIGYMMGKLANEYLGSDPFSKSVVVCTGLAPPLSCLIDGIQISSGCTLGKGNITVQPDGIPKACFTNKNGKRIEISLKPNIEHEIDTTVTERNAESYSKQLFKKSNQELFDMS